VGAWLPRRPSELALARTHDEARLTAAIGPGTVSTTDVEVMERRWRALVARALELAAGPGDEGMTLLGGTLAVIGEQPGRAAWDRLVGLYAGAVGRGRLDKVVLARRVDVKSRDRLDVPAALRRLAASAPESTTFAFSRGRGTFLGATPERLVQTAGRAFETVAIAGSAPRSADGAEDARLGAGLLASEKDREEHAVVVAMLRTSLSPLVEELRVAPSPALLRLRHVQHLVTPMAGTLRDDAGLLALAERLHPTPAVGGEPRALALEMIAEHEGFERGWYAGPIGWVGADGDGELMVALRCGLVEERDATLFAGCGIVADSDPASEWEESRIKLRTVGSALGDVVEAAAQGGR
jgi:isochorismate synthase